MIKLLVAEGHHIVRAGIVKLLNDIPTIKVVGETATGEETVDFCRYNKPDIVLIELQIPGFGGLEATRRILRRNTSTRIIVLTSCTDGPYPARLLQAGASGYLSKSIEFEELLEAISAVSKGQRYLSSDIAKKLALDKYVHDGKRSPFDYLSDREMQIATMIVECHKVQVISANLCLSPKTVNSYRYRIFEKLGIHSDVELVLLALKYGMIQAQRASLTV